MQRVEALDASQTVSRRAGFSGWGSNFGPSLARARAFLAMEVRRPGPIQYTPRLVAYVAAVELVAAVLAILSVHRTADVLGLSLVAGAIGLMATFSVQSVSGVNTLFNASSFLHLGLAVTVGPIGALAGAIAEASAIQLRYKAGAFRTAFNVPLAFLTDYSAWAVFHGLQSLGPNSALFAGMAGLLAGLAHFAVNHALVAGIVSITTGRSFWQFLRQSLPVSPYTLCYGYAAIGFVALHDRFGPLGFTFALAPVMALQIFLVILAARTRAHEDQRNHLLDKLQEESIRVERSYDATLIALTHALDARDKETEGHSRRVVEYTRLVAVRLGIGGEELKLLCHGALLHDIGKIGVPDAILHKPGPLTEAEWQVMRRHPEIGALMVEEVEYLTEAKRIILHHHERWDGRGYPLGLRGAQISQGARAFSIADTVDAITQDRPYRRGRSFDEAREELLRHRGTQFDPDAVDAFLSISEGELRAIAGIRARVGLDLLIGGAQAAELPPVAAVR